MSRREEVGERDIFLKEILSPVLEATNSKNRNKLLSGFLSAKGCRYSGGLMVLGRAPNGWDAQGSRGELSSDLKRDSFFESILEETRGSSGCELGWVEGQWIETRRHKEGKRQYATGRSAFWRCVRRVTGLLEVADADEPGWVSHLVWSNLYKIAPAEGGNPSEAMCRQQGDGCRGLLQLEFETYRPRRVLFLTDTTWAEPPVFDPSGLDYKHNFTQVRRFGRTSIGGSGPETRVVIASHPQAKPEETWQKEVTEAFKLID